MHGREQNGSSRFLKLRPVLVAALAALLTGIMAFNVLLMNGIASEQTERIGQMHLQNIASGLQASLTRAEFTLTRIYSRLEEMLESADPEEIRAFLAEQKAVEYERSGGVCLNVFCVVGGAVMISDMAAPEEYVLQDRGWYRALLAAGRGNICISPTYTDAFTGEMCFTVAIMLEDGSVVGLDYSVAEIQSYIDRMGGEAYGDAMIVDANEVIVGYADPDMIGKKLSSELPQYRDAFLRAVASKDGDLSLRTSVGGESRTIFCSRTENGWYMMCSVSDSALYRGNYGQILRNFILVLALLLAIVGLCFLGGRGQPRAERAEKKEDAKRRGREQRPALTVRDQRKYQIGITSIFIVTMALSIFGSTSMSINESRVKMENELREYHFKVADWILEQKSVLDMFDNVVAARPEMLPDYDGMVKFLDDVTKHYPKISATYIANPDFPHGHPMVMNNGWVPASDYVEEERPWYTGALTAEDFSITEPYYDARTGEYCITFSRAVRSDGGEFYGVFAIDFYLDVLTDILGESYSEEGYAFLADKNGLIIDHPASEYGFSEDNSAKVNIHDLVYDKLYSEPGMVTVRDYDGARRVCASMDESVSGFRIIVAKSWWSIYGNVLEYAVLFLVLFGGCILAVNVVINRMIRWQTRANDRLKKAAEIAIQAEQAKTRFLSNMSHEIRTPINAVLGMNEMILRECGDGQLLHYAENIRSSGKTLLFLVNDILDLSKIESGNMEIVPAEYELADMIFDLWNAIFFRAQEKGLTVDFILDEALPRTLFGDDVRIRQIVTNLLTNAVKYTPRGGIRMRVRRETAEAEQIGLIISVEDTGIGIRQEDMEKLFERFRRLDEKNTRSIEGTGLGLNIAMSLLKLMGGDMRIDSEYQKGSTFTVNIPQRVVNGEPMGDFASVMRGRQRPDAERERNRFEAPEAKVLVVDDNEINLDVFQALLKRTKMNVTAAGSGRECLELVKKERFHIIFMDHMMPEMDGVETLRAIRALTDFPNEATPVIALTANALSGAREFYLKEGFTDFLTKPLDPDLLEEMIVSYLPEELVKTGGTETAIGEDASQKEELRRLEQKGFRVSAGMDYCRGDGDFYGEILVRFARDAERKAADIEDAFQKEDIRNYQILTHALKSSAKMIGADALSEMARAAEDAAKNRDLACLRKNHRPLMERYRETARQISDAFRLTDDAEAPAAAMAEISGEELRLRLSELRECLETFEADRAEALLEGLNGFTYRGAPVRELLRDIARDVEDFELGAAAGKLRELAAGIL